MHNTPIVIIADEGYPSAIIEEPTVQQRADFSLNQNARVVARTFGSATQEELDKYNDFTTDILAIDYLRSVGIEYEGEYYEKGFCVNQAELDLAKFKKI